MCILSSNLAWHKSHPSRYPINIKIGIKIIVLNTVTQNSSNVYQYTYSPAFTQTPFTALGVIGFETANLHEQVLKFWIDNPAYQSNTILQVVMKDATTTSYRQFRTSYIAIDKTFS